MRRVADVDARIARRDWAAVAADLDARGFASLERLLGAGECDALAGALRATSVASAAAW